MSVMGQTRQFRDVGLRSDLPSTADNFGPRRHCAFGPHRTSPPCDYLVGAHRHATASAVASGGMARTIILKGDPKSTRRIYRATCCRGRFPTTYMTAEGKALKEAYQWEAKSQWQGPPFAGDAEVSVRFYFKTKARPRQSKQADTRCPHRYRLRGRQSDQRATPDVTLRRDEPAYGDHLTRPCPH
jgi:Endodeoxyribonuclease RusA